MRVSQHTGCHYLSRRKENDMLFYSFWLLGSLASILISITFVRKVNGENQKIDSDDIIFLLFMLAFSLFFSWGAAMVGIIILMEESDKQ